VGGGVIKLRGTGGYQGGNSSSHQNRNQGDGQGGQGIKRRIFPQPSSVTRTTERYHGSSTMPDPGLYSRHTVGAGAPHGVSRNPQQVFMTVSSHRPASGLNIPPRAIIARGIVISERTATPTILNTPKTPSSLATSTRRSCVGFVDARLDQSGPAGVPMPHAQRSSDPPAFRAEAVQLWFTGAIHRSASPTDALWAASASRTRHLRGRSDKARCQPA